MVDSPDEKKQPTVEIKAANGNTIRRYIMPVSAPDGGRRRHGQRRRRAGEDPRETTKTKDITGGLPRVVELFEARKPKDPAVIEIDGTVRYGGVVKGQRKILIVPDDPNGEPREYSIPRGVHVNVQEGDRVRAGDPLMDGPSNPHDILHVLGEELQKYLVNEIQEVYRLQGVNINDKHIEVITRQMMRWVRVEDVGDTEFLVDEQVDKFRFMEENERVIGNGGRPATAQPLLLGITKASLSTESFISAASFQETTRVTEAAISGKVDYLRGLKENVTMGRTDSRRHGLLVVPARADPGGRTAAAAAGATAERRRARAGSRDGIPGGAGRGRSQGITESSSHEGRVFDPPFFGLRDVRAAARRPAGPLTPHGNAQCRSCGVGAVGAHECGHVQFDHLQHRIGDPLRSRPVAVAHHVVQRLRDDLPPDAEAVDQPAARLRLAAALEQRVPVAIELGLVLADHDHRDGIVELVVRPGGHGLERLPEQGEVDDRDRAFRSARRLGGQRPGPVDAGIREGRRVEPGRRLGVLRVPRCGKICACR